MKTTKRIYVDLHVIQTVPPSCVNRDDTGSPKTAIYGGVRRARVSSQSWKKAIRDMFREELDESEMGIRTKKIVELVAQEICKIDSKIAQDKAFELAEKAVNACGIKTKDGEAKALFFLGVKQAQDLAKLIFEELMPIQEKRAQLEKQSDYVSAVIEEGNKKAQAEAAKTILEVKDKFGFNSFF